MKYLLLLLIPTLGYAQINPLELTEDDLDPPAEDILIKKPEKHLRHESMIYDLNSDLGIRDQRKFTGQDRNRFSLAGHISSDYEHFNELLGGEVTYMRRTSRYNQVWWGGQFFQHQSRFDAVTKNHTTGGLNSEASFKRPNDAKNTIQAFGLGAGYRFKLLLDFFETEDTFESIDVFANALRFNESEIDKTYSGWGLTTNYGIHKRSSTNFFYGGKMSYNLAVVSREQIAKESKRERTLSLGWLAFALEMGFFY